MKTAPWLAAALITLTSCQTAPEKAAPPQTSGQSSSSPDHSMADTQAAAPVADSSGRVTTASGLQYRVISSGPEGGQSPSTFDSVIVHYRGMLTDGTVSDSSIERGQPATFGVGQVIPGWTEALKLMKPGDQWVLYIPSRLAYGSRAVGDKIPAHSDLIFQVALIQVVKGF
jgi:FKBP-type peptidyl-prolyl cis-trans isomerase FklB